MKILVIDDEECIRDTYRWHLEELGHEVLTAPEPMMCDVYNGHDCQKTHSCADLLIIDFNMPRVTGLEFIEMLSMRGCKSLSSNKVIISGDTTSIDMVKVKQLGCQVLQKPVPLDRLEEIVRDAEKRLCSNDS